MYYSFGSAKKVEARSAQRAAGKKAKFEFRGNIVTGTLPVF